MSYWIYLLQVQVSHGQAVKRNFVIDPTTIDYHAVILGDKSFQNLLVEMILMVLYHKENKVKSLCTV